MLDVEAPEHVGLLRALSLSFGMIEARLVDWLTVKAGIETNTAPDDPAAEEVAPDIEDVELALRQAPEQVDAKLTDQLQSLREMLQAHLASHPATTSAAGEMYTGATQMAADVFANASVQWVSDFAQSWAMELLPKLGDKVLSAADDALTLFMLFAFGTVLTKLARRYSRLRWIEEAWAQFRKFFRDLG